jgi:hypothetical protein
MVMAIPMVKTVQTIVISSNFNPMVISILGVTVIVISVVLSIRYLDVTG